jgi:N-acetylglucosaminyl-diphospho-decaprenol L-rhamnosyltransferase
MRADVREKPENTARASALTRLASNMVDTESVAAVIVHYRTPEQTVRAARAVAQSTCEVEVVVVDNASGDAVGRRLATEVPRARLVTEEENRGYGAACNRGARETAGKYLLFLNSDTATGPGAAAALVAALEADPSAAAAGPRLLNPDGSLQPSIQRLPTLWRIFCESSGLAALSGGRGVFRGHMKTREDHGRPHPVTAVKGAALLVRRSAFDEVGGFDESFFLYAEETDLLARLSARGHRILYEPRAEVAHLGGGSGGDALFGHLHAGLRRYVEKHHGKAAGKLAAAMLALGAAARWLLAVVTPGESARQRRLRYRSALSASPKTEALRAGSGPAR